MNPSVNSHHFDDVVKPSKKCGQVDHTRNRSCTRAGKARIGASYMNLFLSFAHYTGVFALLGGL
jgi:hypothetical protein